MCHKAELYLHGVSAEPEAFSWNEELSDNELISTHLFSLTGWIEYVLDIGI